MHSGRPRAGKGDNGRLAVESGRRNAATAHVHVARARGATTQHDRERALCYGVTPGTPPGCGSRATRVAVCSPRPSVVRGSQLAPIHVAGTRDAAPSPVGHTGHFPGSCRQQDDRLSARGLAATVVVVVRATAGGARSAALTQHRVGAGGDARWSGQRRAIRTRARAVGKFAAGDNKSTGKNVAMCTTRGLARRLRTVAMSQVHEACARRPRCEF